MAVTHASHPVEGTARPHDVPHPVLGMMITAYRLQLGTRVRVDTLLHLRIGEAASTFGVGLLHCNNVNSSNIYGSVYGGMLAIEEAHLSGADGPLLLQALHSWHDGEVAAALRTLKSPLVRANRTSQGGHNDFGDVLALAMSTQAEAHTSA